MYLSLSVSIVDVFEPFLQKLFNSDISMKKIVICFYNFIFWYLNI